MNGRNSQAEEERRRFEEQWSEEVGVYLSNGFTRGFQEAIGTNPAISLRDLYYTLARNTSGSHVKIYNAPHYGSAYSNNMSEFLNKNK